MTSDLAYPAQKEFSFLQTVVSEELGHRHERKDSNKLSVTGLSGTSVQTSATESPDRPGTMKTEQREDTLKAHSGKDHNSNKIWEDFLSDEEIEKKKQNKEVKRDISDDMQFTNSGQSEKERDTVCDVPDTAGREHNDGRRDGLTGKNLAKKKKQKHKLKQAAPVIQPPASAATSESQPDYTRHGNARQEVYKAETMSEVDGRQARKLGRRQRMSAVRQADPVTSEQILHQKIQELQALMVKPLVAPVQYLHQTRQELVRLHGFSQHHSAQFLGSSTHQQLGTRDPQHPLGDLNSNNSDDDIYSVLRSAQLRRPWTSGHVRPRHQQGKHRPGRPYTAEHHASSSYQDVDGNTRHGSAAPVNGPRRRGHDRNNQIHKEDDGDHSASVTDASSGRHRHQLRHRVDKHQSPDTRDGSSKSRSASPGKEIQPSDTHLKHSHNPALNKWLKQKNKELRRQKAEERKRLREERAKKQEALRARQEMFKDSEKKVKEWMVQKRKEAWRKAMEERRETQENKFRTDRDRQREAQGILRSRSLEHVSTHTGADKRAFIPVIRPATVQGQISPGREPTSQNNEPAVSQFVYKRPVSGHVRLMKLQQKLKYDAKKSDEERKAFEKKLAEEKCKKMRMSYDQWLLKKREEDYAKRQEIAKQKAMAKSDPELERILPELARRRIENIQRGKKRADTGMNHLDNHGNTSARDQTVTETQENLLPDETHENMKVTGQRQVLRQRPTSAKIPFNPQESKSPRRPVSARLPNGSAVDASNSDVPQPKPFRLPFPPQEGAPRYVLATQKRLFSPHITSNVSQSPDAPQEDTQVVSDSAQESDEAPHQADLQTGEGTARQHTDLETCINQDPAQPHEEDDSFFVTHGNLGEVKAGEIQFSQSELSQKAEQADEIDHWEKLTSEVDVNPNNVEHSSEHKDNQNRDITDCVDDEQINEAGDEEQANRVTENTTRDYTSGCSTSETPHAQNSQDECTVKRETDILELTDDMSVVDKSSHESYLELSSGSVSRKHVSFQAGHLVHEVSDVSEASDIDKDDSRVEVLPPDVENSDQNESKHKQKVSSSDQEDDDEDIVATEKNSKPAIQEDVDVSTSSTTDDLFPDEDDVHKVLGAPEDPGNITLDNTDSEV